MCYTLGRHDARPAFMHHTDPTTVYQPHRVGMMHECSTGELLARAAFMHHADKEHDALKHYAALTGVGKVQTCSIH